MGINYFPLFPKAIILYFYLKYYNVFLSHISPYNTGLRGSKQMPRFPSSISNVWRFNLL